jgi:hypothetical protein
LFGRTWQYDSLDFSPIGAVDMPWLDYVCIVEGMNVLAKMQCPRKQLEAHAEAALLALGAGSANQGLAK